MTQTVDTGNALTEAFALWLQDYRRRDWQNLEPEERNTLILYHTKEFMGIFKLSCEHHDVQLAWIKATPVESPRFTMDED